MNIIKSFNNTINYLETVLDGEISRENFQHVDTTPYAKEGTLHKLIDERFGE